MPSDSYLRRYREILGVQEGASAADVKRAYHRQAQKWHPDFNAGDPAVAEARMKEINEAYAVLTGRAGVAAGDAGAGGRTGYGERAERGQRAAEDERTGWAKGTDWTNGGQGTGWTRGAGGARATKVPNRARNRTVAAIAAAFVVWAGARFYSNRAAEQARAQAARIAAYRQREAEAQAARAAADARTKAERTRKARAAADARAKAERARTTQATRAAEEERDRRDAEAENARAAQAAEDAEDAEEKTAAPPTVTLIAATQVRAKVDSQILTKAGSAGGTVTVTLDADITVGGRVVARRGAGGLGVVTSADKGFVEIRLTSLTLGGRAVPISTDRVRVLADRAIPQGTPVQFLLAAPVTVRPAE
jgi:curved DNA-binding protein CbpA